MLRLESPLAEKRTLFLMNRRVLIGRRAYSDSVFLSRRDEIHPTRSAGLACFARSAVYPKYAHRVTTQEHDTTSTPSSPRSSCSNSSTDKQQIERT